VYVLHFYATMAFDKVLHNVVLKIFFTAHFHAPALCLEWVNRL